MKKLAGNEMVEEAKKTIDKIFEDWKKKSENPELLPDKNVDKCVKLYELSHAKMSYDNPISLVMDGGVLNEALIKSYDIDSTMRYIKNYFGLEDWQIEKMENDFNPKAQNCHFSIIIPTVGNNLDEVEKALAYCGWFVSTKNETMRIKNNSANKWVKLQCEPKYSKQLERTEVPRNLYHYTPKYLVKKIMENGLVPISKNDLFKFPGRVYFMGGTSKKNMDSYAKIISDNNKNKRNDGDYVVLKIDRNDLPENIKFERDPNMKIGYYTYDNISPKYIAVDREVHFNKPE